MLAGAVRSYINRYAAAPGQRVAVFTNNDDGWRTAADLARGRRRDRGRRSTAARASRAGAIRGARRRASWPARA